MICVFTLQKKLPSCSRFPPGWFVSIFMIQKVMRFVLSLLRCLTPSFPRKSCINALKTGGKLTVSKGRLPLGWSGDALTDVEAVTTFEGARITVESFNARQCFGDVQLSGTIGLQNAREPELHLHRALMTRLWNIGCIM